MHTCIPSHGLKRSWQSCPIRVKQKHTQDAPSTKTKCDYLYNWIRNDHIRKDLPQNGEVQRYNLEGRIRIRMVNPRDVAGKVEEEEEWRTPEILLGRQKEKNYEAQRYSL